MLLIPLSFNAVGLQIGQTYQNATCYNEKNIISLSSWLILVTLMALISGSIIILLILLSILFFVNGNRFLLLLSIPCIIFIGSAWLFSFVMNIIGIVELTYQFPTCKHEVPAVCTTIIVIIVVNTMTLVGGGCGMKINNTRIDYIELD
jgi:hypothetical protein